MSTIMSWIEILNMIIRLMPIIRALLEALTTPEEMETACEEVWDTLTAAANPVRAMVLLSENVTGWDEAMEKVAA